MSSWTLLTLSIIVILGFLPIGIPAMADELSLHQVISAVNFASMSIEAAELRTNVYMSPHPLPKSLQEKMEVDLQQLKIQYQNASHPVEEQTLAQHIKTAEDMQNFPPLPRYYECTVIFRRNSIKDDYDVIERLKSLFSYRIIRVNRASKHADPQLLKSIPQIVRGAYTGQEILIQICNGESIIMFTLNDRLVNTAYFEEPTVPLMIILFQGGSVSIPINPESVIDFHPVAQNGTTLYSIEYTPDISGSALTGVSKLRSTRILVNPSKAFTVTKMEGFLHLGGTKVLESVAQFDNFKLFPRGIWYPTSINLTQYKEGQKVSEYIFDIHEANFNISIPHDFFHVQENEIRRRGIDILSN